MNEQSDPDTEQELSLAFATPGVSKKQPDDPPGDNPPTLTPPRDCLHRELEHKMEVYGQAPRALPRPTTNLVDLVRARVLSVSQKDAECLSDPTIWGDAVRREIADFIGDAEAQRPPHPFAINAAQDGSAGRAVTGHRSGWTLTLTSNWEDHHPKQ